MITILGPCQTSMMKNSFERVANHFRKKSFVIDTGLVPHTTFLK